MSKVADKVELTFAQFIYQFDEFKAIKKVVYDKENRKLLFQRLKSVKFFKLGISQEQAREN